ncbi:MAG: hypothetical protein PUC12_01355 [Clostridiales bacterium]|nr:hypothetical protein [Clostridiales bacterium]
MSVKEQKNRGRTARIEDTRYSGSIPQEILNEMSQEIVTQYYLWDEVTKRELELYPWLILPLINEVFHKTYPEGTTLRLLATEYVVTRLHSEGGTTLNSIYADIAVQIGNRDIYHLECQMEKEKEMVFRMLEYDTHIALVHGKEENLEKDGGLMPNLIMPRSVILYLANEEKVPSQEICRIHFADGRICEYRVPVLKVQDYSLEMIEKKHLNMLIPFLPIRFRNSFNKMRMPENEKVRKNRVKF